VILIIGSTNTPEKIDADAQKTIAISTELLDILVDFFEDFFRELVDVSFLATVIVNINFITFR
jgi:hypothetical protein